jgi:hypothetical protein
MNNSDKIVELLQKFWPKNKAKGLLAETIFSDEIEGNAFGTDGKDKIIRGCWLLAPKEPDFYKFRFSFFVHPVVMREGDMGGDLKEIFGDKYRPFHALAEFMNCAGIGIVYAICSTVSGQIPLDELRAGNFERVKWTLLGFQDGAFKKLNAEEFFGKWQGNRGRAGHGGGWESDTIEQISRLREDVLTTLLLDELFVTGFLKGTLKKPLSDPYNVDSFLISISQKYIFPIEIKEKFLYRHGGSEFFGIDAGRIMMLLRLCLANDANAVYLIRELDESHNFIAWKYITLSDIIMTSSWNLQAGGKGMQGQATQTVMMPYSHFKNFNKDEISEENLKNIGNMPKEAKIRAKEFSEALLSKFY